MTSASSNSGQQNYEYQVGGSLKLESPTYVTRRADGELYDGLKQGAFCYVLNSRQMGKSSLRVQTMARLQREGVACVAIQMTDIIEEEMSSEEWYAGVVNSIATDLDLDFDDFDWWDHHSHLSVVNRFSKFIDDVLLRLVQTPIVIFIDEIDRILSLPFKVNGFFAVVRECSNKRADQEKYRRLTFALLGVATPSDLIEDKRSTPFNVGRAIELRGFTPEEAAPLAGGLGAISAQPQETLQAILAWTGGQPFLTQKICNLLVRRGNPMGPEAVDGFVRDHIIQNWEANDEPEHLRTIRDRLLRDEQKAGRRIGLYQQILGQGGLTADAANMDHIELRLSGLVVERQGRLSVYNPVCREIFDQGWAEQALANLRPYAASITAWQGSGRQDRSRLLRGQALTEARQWAADKVLPPEDYLYLAASQELATEEVEAARQTLAEANETLSAANEQATERITSANRRIRIGSAILIGALALSTWVGYGARQLSVSADEKVLEAERKSSDANTKLKQADKVRKTAENAKDSAEEDRDLAEQGLTKAQDESDAIKYASELRVAEANEQVVQAEMASEQARQEQAEAQRRADEAQEVVAYAQQAELDAKNEQERAKAGTQLYSRRLKYGHL